jgi:fluoroquinolone transport system permease protein
MKEIIKLAIIDFKLIFRDSSLRTFLFFPIILISLIIWALPVLVTKHNFLIPYLPIFLVVAVIENTQMFCFISSMVLIDEKESDVYFCFIFAR